MCGAAFVDDVEGRDGAHGFDIPLWFIGDAVPGDDVPEGADYVGDVDGVDAEVFCPEPFHLFVEVLVDSCHGEGGGYELRGVGAVDMGESDDYEVESGVISLNPSIMSD